VGEAHRRTTNFINTHGRWTGHLFQSRFASVAMDESHPVAAVRHVSLNPVRARLTRKAEDWARSSVRAHLTTEDDELVSVAPALTRSTGSRPSSNPIRTMGPSARFGRRREADARLEMPTSLPTSNVCWGGLSPDVRPGESRSAQGAERLDLLK
jgi:hypothetical protein